MANLYTDHDFSRYVVAALRAIGHDVLTTYELGLADAPDAQQLLTATSLGRIMMTYNRRDF